MKSPRDPRLFRQAALIGGNWLQAKDEADPVFNPATGEMLGQVPRLGKKETLEAIALAQEAFGAWRKRPAIERARVLQNFFSLIVDNEDDLALILTQEQGKPLAEARGEARYAASFVEWFAQEARRACGMTMPSPEAKKRLIVTKEPVGVVAAITPWNFPLAMVTRKVTPALAAGCAVVLKPAPETPFSALALGELAMRAGLPPGLFNILTGDAQAIGDAMCKSPLVRALTFTGSTGVGKLLMAQSAQTVKKVVLELGGHAPFIVFPDADMGLAVKGAVRAKLRSSGQTCVSPNRFLIHEEVYEAFSSHLVRMFSRMRLGDGLADRVDVGPLISPKAVQKAKEHVEDALAKGARLLCGGQIASPGGNFLAPTVLGDCNPEMRVFQEETFAPVAPLCRFSGEDMALELANATPYGLAAYFYTRDLGRAIRVGEALEYGMVGVNTTALSLAEAPFGGFKSSGLGREGSFWGMEEYLEVKYWCLETE